MLTLALLVPLTAGDYDLSVAATMTLVGDGARDPEREPRLVDLARRSSRRSASGVAVGLVNGALVVLLDIDSLIATLGSSTFIAGVVLWISDSQTISGVSDGLIDSVVVDRFLGIPLDFYYGIALGARALLRVRVHAGRAAAALRRPRPQRRPAVRDPRRRGCAGARSSPRGMISAFAGVLYAGTLGSADPTSALSFLLPAFAAAFLGATTIMPGRFNPLGSIAAVYFLVTGITGLQLLGVQTFVQQLFYGGALVLAVALSQLARRRDARAAA